MSHNTTCSSVKTCRSTAKFWMSSMIMLSKTEWWVLLKFLRSYASFTFHGSVWQTAPGPSHWLDNRGRRNGSHLSKPTVLYPFHCQYKLPGSFVVLTSGNPPLCSCWQALGKQWETQKWFQTAAALLWFVGNKHDVIPFMQNTLVLGIKLELPISNQLPQLQKLHPPLFCSLHEWNTTKLELYYA